MSAEKRNAIKGKLENLLPMIDERDSDWACDWDNDKQEKYYILFMHNTNKCFITSDRTNQRIGAIYMSKETAEFIKDKINSGLKKKVKGL